MKKILIFGHFNLLHTGHIRLFQYAKSLGGSLIIAVESDKIAGKKVSENQNERLNIIKKIKIIDKAFIYYDNLEKTILKVKPDIIVKGKEFENKSNPEEKILKKIGGKLIFSSGFAFYNTKFYLQKEPKNKLILKKQVNFLKKRKLINFNFIDHLESLKKLRVCLIGDLIIDEYINCIPLGMSREDFSIVISPKKKESYLGGAAIVAKHIAGIGAKVDFYSLVGNDLEGKRALNELRKIKNINPFLLNEKFRNTTIKQRFIVDDKVNSRITYLEERSLDTLFEKKLFNMISSKIDKYDLLVLSDFNYGLLTENLSKMILDLFKKNKICIVADSQSSSQRGNLSKFYGSNLILPTEYEARQHVKSNDDGLVVLCEKLRSSLNAKNIILKIGKNGIFVHKHLSKNTWDDDRIDAMNEFPKNLTGAGDAMLALSSLSFAKKKNIWIASYLGSIASAIQIAKEQNTNFEFEDIKEFFLD